MKLKRYLKMKNNKLIYIAIILSIFIFFIIYFKNNIYNYIIDRSTSRIDTVLVSDTVRRIDTLTIFKEKPIPKEVYLTKIDTFYTKDGKDTLLKSESKIYQDTLCQKQDTIILKSYISGINSKIDSLKADWRKSETIITNTVEITKYIEKKKTFLDKFHIGLQTGYGYGFKSKEFTPYVGFGCSIDL